MAKLSMTYKLLVSRSWYPKAQAQAQAQAQDNKIQKLSYFYIQPMKELEWINRWDIHMILLLWVFPLKGFFELPAQCKSQRWGNCITNLPVFVLNVAGKFIAIWKTLNAQISKVKLLKVGSSNKIFQSLCRQFVSLCCCFGSTFVQQIPPFS